MDFPSRSKTLPTWSRRNFGGETDGAVRASATTKLVLRISPAKRFDSLHGAHSQVQQKSNGPDDNHAGDDEIVAVAGVPGIDVIFAASVDLGNFSGHKQGEPEYEALVKRIHDVTLGHGIKLGGPQAWNKKPGFSFFQGPGETQLIRIGAKSNLNNEVFTNEIDTGARPAQK